MCYQGYTSASTALAVSAQRRDIDRVVATWDVPRRGAGKGYEHSYMEKRAQKDKVLGNGRRSTTIAEQD